MCKDIPVGWVLSCAGHLGWAAIDVDPGRLVANRSSPVVAMAMIRLPLKRHLMM